MISYIMLFKSYKCKLNEIAHFMSMCIYTSLLKTLVFRIHLITPDLGAEKEDMITAIYKVLSITIMDALQS